MLEKNIIKVIASLVFISALGVLVYKGHYEPTKELVAKIEAQKITIESLNSKLSIASVKVAECSTKEFESNFKIR